MLRAAGSSSVLESSGMVSKGRALNMKTIASVSQGENVGFGGGATDKRSKAARMGHNESAATAFAYTGLVSAPAFTLAGLAGAMAACSCDV